MLRLILLSTALAAGLTSWPTSDSTSEFASGPADKDWTILVYGASDNSSEESFVPDMHSLMQGLASPGIEVLGFVDRSPEFSNDAIGLGEDFADSRLYRLTSNGPRRVGGGEHFPEITVDSEYEANSGAVATLRKALRWAKATSPAKRYGVIFYSHGGGWSWCPDDTDGGDQLYPAELTVGLEAQDSLDLMVFDVCLMGGIENAYQWRPREDAFGVDVMLATPMAGYPFPWGSILENIAAGEIDTADLTAREFGRIIVQVTKAHRTRMQDRSGEFAQVTRNEAMACYDLSKAAAVKSAVDQLARELASIEGAEEKVRAMRGSGDEIPCLNYMGSTNESSWRHYPYFDLFQLAGRIGELPSGTEALRKSALILQDRVDDMVLDSFGMANYDSFGGFEAGVHGLSIVFPDGDAKDATGRSHWERFTWFTAKERSQKDGQFGRYDWCADGASAAVGGVGNWYQLLQSWYE